MKKLHLALGLIACCCLQQAPVLAQSNHLSDANRNNSAGRTILAERYYRLAVAQNPKDPVPHYYLANFLAKNGRHNEAIEEYSMAYNLNPNGSVAGYCRQALTAYRLPRLRNNAYAPYDYGGHLEPSAMTRYTEKLLGSPTRATQKNAPEQNTDVAAASSTIKRDLQGEKEKNQVFADNLAKSAIKAGDWKGRDIKDQTEHEIRQMYDSTVTIHSSRRGSARDVLRARAEQMRKEAEERAEYERALAAERSESHKRWSKERQKELEESAANLQDQMTQKSPYGTDLNPVGTGLYVRNYKTTPGKKKLPDPRFSVLRFVDKGYEGLGGDSADDSAKHDSDVPVYDSDDTVEIKDVKGKITP